MDRSKLYRRFRTLLIANRGEIACRVIRSARAMGLRTVAVYSEADRDAMHVAMADEAVLLGPARARDSYLNIERVIEAARKTGAEAVHPGYGFLSENAEFAQACLDAGLVFVGPTAAMMTAMGSKSGSKALMEKAGVPLVPGYHGEAQDEATLAKAADKIGFPVLVKASAGGGGRGMRVVNSAGELAAAVTSAKREAKAAFGDDRMLIEKFVQNPRHIEVPQAVAIWPSRSRHPARSSSVVIAGSSFWLSSNALHASATFPAASWSRPWRNNTSACAPGGWASATEDHRTNTTAVARFIDISPADSVPDHCLCVFAAYDPRVRRATQKFNSAPGAAWAPVVGHPRRFDG